MMVVRELFCRPRAQRVRQRLVDAGLVAEAPLLEEVSRVWVGDSLLDLVSRLVVNNLVLLVVDQILISELLSHLG
jgi:hypothetical protein